MAARATAPPSFERLRLMPIETVRIVSPVSEGNPHGYIVINKADLAEGDVIFGESVETPEEIAEDAKLASDGVTKDDLIAQAQAAGVEIDRRWSAARIHAAILAAAPKG